jgi:hypothetical protein
LVQAAGARANWRTPIGHSLEAFFGIACKRLHRHSTNRHDNFPGTLQTLLSKRRKIRCQPGSLCAAVQRALLQRFVAWGRPDQHQRLCVGVFWRQAASFLRRARPSTLADRRLASLSPTGGQGLDRHTGRRTLTMGFMPRPGTASQRGCEDSANSLESHRRQVACPYASCGSMLRKCWLVRCSADEAVTLSALTTSVTMRAFLSRAFVKKNHIVTFARSTVGRTGSVAKAGYSHCQVARKS